MTIQKNREGEKLTVAIDGRLDTNTAPELEKELGESLNGVTELVFDFNELDYISSAGLRVLLGAQKRMTDQGSMVIKGSSEDICQIFEITGFSEILTLE